MIVPILPRNVHEKILQKIKSKLNPNLIPFTRGNIIYLKRKKRESNKFQKILHVNILVGVEKKKIFQKILHDSHNLLALSLSRRCTKNTFRGIFPVTGCSCSHRPIRIYCTWYFSVTPSSRSRCFSASYSAAR